MLLSVNRIYGERLGALDGEIGKVKDLYFDDLNWTVRYLVVETGSWLMGRQVLISPHASSGFAGAGRIIPMDLTRKQIEDSPSIETHKPVSRQFEVEFYRYYGLPFYWQGGGLWGMSGFPQVPMLPESLANEPDLESRQFAENTDAHLRSTQAVNGHHIEANDGPIGHVGDFLMDAKDWSLRQLVVRTGSWLPGIEVLIPTNRIERIVNEESLVRVDMTREAVSHGPVNHQAAVGA